MLPLKLSQCLGKGLSLEDREGLDVHSRGEEVLGAITRLGSDKALVPDRFLFF